MNRCIVFSIAGVSLLTSGLALAGPVGRYDPFNGKELAKKLCANCHVVDSQQQEALADVPSFNEIANKEGQSAAAIMGHIMLPAAPPCRQSSSLKMNFPTSPPIFSACASRDNERF